jgi:membrane protein DedA with SNARE-associated domain
MQTTLPLCIPARLITDGDTPMTLSQLFSHYGYIVLLLGSLCDGMPVMLFGGFAAHRGWLTLTPHVILAGAVGNFLAWCVWFFGARAVGERLLERRPRWAKAVEGIRPRLKRWEAPTVVLARFVPGVDTPAILALALSAIPVSCFLAWNAVGALLWAVAFGLLGYALGPAVQTLLGDVKRYEEPVGALLLTAGILWIAYYQWQRWRGQGGAGLRPGVGAQP